MISVCIATYNGAKYINKQLGSVLKQLGKDDEVIVSDDHSIDDTVQIIRNLNDHRVKIFFNPGDPGYSSNFENAILQSTGDYIFICDQDDVWIDGKVSKMMNCLIAGTHLVVSDAEIVDKNLNQLFASHFELNNTRPGFAINFLKTRYIGACMAFNREILSKVLPFPSNHYLCAYDYWIALISEYYYSVKLLKEPLLRYRRHGENASTGGGTKSPNSLLKKIRTRLYVMGKIIERRNS